MLGFRTKTKKTPSLTAAGGIKVKGETLPAPLVEAVEEAVEAPVKLIDQLRLPLVVAVWGLAGVLVGVTSLSIVGAKKLPKAAGKLAQGAVSSGLQGLASAQPPPPSQPSEQTGRRRWWSRRARSA